MKKGCLRVLFVLIFFLIIFLCSFCNAEQTITSDAVSNDVAISIYVEGPPSLVIHLPYNETYIKNYSIPLNYSMNGNNAWYNIDDGENASLSCFTRFNAADGFHLLKVFANDSYGVTKKNRWFAVNTTIIKFFYDEYKGEHKGNSTDFLEYTYERLDNVTTILENALYGKIEWYDLINFTSLAVVDCDEYANISYNRIYFAPEEMLLLNKSAKISLYNLTFSNPVILRNGETCPASICTLISYENETLIFNITSFVSSSVYSISEPFKIIWPEGIYEPYSSGLAGTHRFTFNITFANLTAAAGSMLECNVEMSNKSILILNKTINADISNAEEHLSYTLNQSDSIDKNSPWKVKNCTLSLGGDLLFITSYYGPLNGNIYVHNNNWTRFSSIDNDAYRAADCFLGIPKRYFNNSYYCDYAGDVAFAVTMSRGMNLEGECHDSIDNDANGLIDCNDIYCAGITYSCINHIWAGDPFGGTCQNGICRETKTVGGKSFTYSYTKYAKPNGMLKVRFEGAGYNTVMPVSFAITALNSFVEHGEYNKSGYLALPNEQISFTSYKTEAPNGINGNIDMVMYVRLNSSYYPTGNYNFSVYVRQYGEDLLIAGIPVIISSDAPSNANESESMPGIITNPCSDLIDNDLDYLQDCADTGCIGQIGGTNCNGGNAFCQLSESTCYDCFDNNANGKTDCADSSCDLQSGNYQNLSNLCEYKGEGYGSINITYNSIYPWISACADNFNNDAEDGIDCYDTTHCKSKGGTSLTLPCPAYENNSAAWCFDNLDNDYDGLKDCLDPDCIGVEYNGKKCQLNETLDENGNFNASRCFDNIDNDLSGLKDCADSNCWGITNPSNQNQTCQAQEFNLTAHYQYCTDNFDNNLNGLLDCNDLSCKQKFGACGPCASIENITWRSCADGLDNNLNGLIDCADTDCIEEIGNVAGGQRCGPENCADGFDNNANGLTDCADSACNLQTGPNNEICQPFGETNCNDSLDNDADGLIDCADPGCFGVSSCSASWNASLCTTVPFMTPLAQVGATTISVSYLSRHHINTNYAIRIKGTGSYSVVTITLGDATDASKYFAYNATSCALNGTDNLKWISSQTAVGQVQVDNTKVNQSNPLSGFDINLTCSSLNSPVTKSYPITIANLQSGNSETAETLLTSTVYENTAPTIAGLEIEPFNGKINYGDSIKIRIIPNSDESGICKCYLNVSSTIYESPDANCIVTLVDIRNDTNYTFSAMAKDGANNIGGWTSTQNFFLDVAPKKLTAALDKNEPFYKGTENVSFTGNFASAYNNIFGLCYYALKNSTGIVSSGTVQGSVSENLAACNISAKIPSTDDMYKFEVSINDSDNATAISDSKVFYVCNNLSSSGNAWTCSKADFDQDGVTEGVYTDLYGNSQACDMCPGIVDSGTDKNANGIDDICEISIPPVIAPTPSLNPPILKADFTVEPKEIQVKMKIGENITKKLTVKNTGETALLMEVDLKLLGKLIKEPVSELLIFRLNPGEEKEINLLFAALEEGTYPSQIIINGNGIVKKVPVIIIVEKSAKPAMPLPANIIIAASEQATAGEKFRIDIKLSNVTISPTEGTLTYQIKDFQDRVVWEISEPVIIEEKLLTKEITIPQLAPGNYVLSAIIKYDDVVIIGTKTFSVVSKIALPLALTAALGALLGKVTAFIASLIKFITSLINMPHL
jgi:hypothetical protein